MPNPKKGLPPGTPAPDFTLPTAGGASIHLGDYHGRWVTLFFFRGVF
ncbi:MAG TPA: redoxin domain-containing protein [Ktedonobacterales bacterium]|jgi:peroxiredoxin|nr:redoxin domain-containing protein [Ktedonobacterales bacterium]